MHEGRGSVDGWVSVCRWMRVFGWMGVWVGVYKCVCVGGFL